MTGTEICNFCIEIMEWWSNNIPISYGTINVLLFIIIEPLLVLYYFANAIIFYLVKEKRTLKTILFIVSFVVFLLTIVCTMLLIIIPILDIGMSLHL